MSFSVLQHNTRCLPRPFIIDIDFFSLLSQAVSYQKNASELVAVPREEKKTTRNAEATRIDAADAIHSI